MSHLLNKLFLLLMIAFATIVPFAGCSDKDTKENKREVKESYLCPMKCTSEIFSKPGKCPVCNMELEKAEPS
ncbi:MAG: hypothetical protein HYU69_15410 [Bacteroidetes bacterium]|nr:hypothetical protein [Bacteroidota bacterium]